MEVYKGIVQVAAAMSRDGIGKDRENKGQGYRFRGIDDIYNALSAHLAAANICIIPRVLSREVVERTAKSGGAMFYVTVQVEYDLVSAKDGSKHTACAFGEAQDSGDKATNKAMSAAYKYMAMQLFCIPTEGDNDADASTPPEAAPSRAKPVGRDALVADLQVARKEVRDAGKAEVLTPMTAADVKAMSVPDLVKAIADTRALIGEAA